MIGQQRGIARALAQRRHGQQQHVEAEGQIVAEAAGLQQLVEARVGSGDDAHVAGAFAAAAHRPVGEILQKAQQRHLRPLRQ